MTALADATGADALDLMWCMFPDHATALAAARRLVDEGLVACANVLAPGQSVYRWQGSVTQSEEVPLLSKVAAGCGSRAAARLAEIHPYDVPAICWWPAGCSPDVAAWARSAGDLG